MEEVGCSGMFGDLFLQTAMLSGTTKQYFVVPAFTPTRAVSFISIQ